jgi:hypothetical protein
MAASPTSNAEWEEREEKEIEGEGGAVLKLRSAEGCTSNKLSTLITDRATHCGPTGNFTSVNLTWVQKCKLHPLTMLLELCASEDSPNVCVLT